jgi:protein SCO1/2
MKLLLTRLMLLSCLTAILPWGAGRIVLADEGEVAIALKSEWIGKSSRKEIAQLDIGYTNQESKAGTLRDLIDRPTVITFFYSRCQNGAKCSAALMRFTALQNELKRLGLSEKVRMLAITYEPEFDDPARLKSFGADRGLKFTADCQALRLDNTRHESLIKALKAPVSFNGGAVNTHGVALHVLDTNGRLTRQYHTLLWDNDQVLQDLAALIDEQ